MKGRRAEGPQFVCWVEGQTDKLVMDIVVRRVLNDKLGERRFKFKCIPFSGKDELKKEIRKSIEGYKDQEAFFLILCDRDNDDCIQLKGDLCSEVPERNRGRTVVRVAVRQLENFFLGDVNAVLKATQVNKVKGKIEVPGEPDEEPKPEEVLQRLMGRKYVKQVDSERIAEHLSLGKGANKSRSFQVLLEGVRTLAAASRLS